jgi:hypothetical protein
MSSVSAVMLLAASAVALAWTYFRRYELMRPPVGVFNGHDVVLMLVAVSVVPLLYLVAPIAIVATLVAAIAFNILFFGCEAAVRRRAYALTIAGAIVGANVAATIAFGAATQAAIVVNDAALVLVAAVVANMLAQAGMSARNLALLAAGLTAYDVVATSFMSLMEDVLRRLFELPFAPLVLWREGENLLGLGLGDLLLLTLAPLVFRKAFGRRAGAVAATLGLAATALILVLVRFGVLEVAVPVVLVLGPLTVVQYAVWRRRAGAERTTREYLLAEPAGRRLTRARLESLRAAPSSPLLASVGLGKEVTS